MNEEQYKKMMDYLNSEEFEKNIEEYCQKINLENENKKDFFYSERFKEILDGFKKSNLLEICSESYLYNKSLYDFLFKNEEEFYLFLNSISYVLSDDVISDGDYDFSNEIIYIDNEIKLETIHGQGSITRLIKLDNKVKFKQKINLNNESDSQESYGYHIIEFENGKKEVYPFGNLVEVIKKLVLK